MKRALTTAFALIALTLAVTASTVACSSGPAGPGVANTGSPAATSSSQPGTHNSRASALAFSQCMRAHGLTGFPDPNASGVISATGIDPNSAAYKTAIAACQGLLPAQAPGQQSQNLQQGLKLAKCMRTHGVPNFPDPNSQGGFSGTSGGNGPGNTGIDPQSPQFQQAQATCDKLLGIQAPSVNMGGGGA